jgi:hypothetical protein
MERIRQHVEHVPLLDWESEDTDVTPTTAVGQRYLLPLPAPPEGELTADPSEDWPTIELEVGSDGMATVVANPPPVAQSRPTAKPRPTAQPRPAGQPAQHSAATAFYYAALGAAAAATALAALTALL